VREFCKITFEYLGLDYLDYVREDALSFRQSELATLVGDITKAKSELGWKPTVTFNELIKMMVEADIGLVKESYETKGL
jgi:GDPmannose 4,6-dehydratase